MVHTYSKQNNVFTNKPPFTSYNTLSKSDTPFEGCVLRDSVCRLYRNNVPVARSSRALPRVTILLSSARGLSALLRHYYGIVSQNTAPFEGCITFAESVVAGEGRLVGENIVLLGVGVHHGVLA